MGRTAAIWGCMTVSSKDCLSNSDRILLDSLIPLSGFARKHLARQKNFQLQQNKQKDLFNKHQERYDSFAADSYVQEYTTRMFWSRFVDVLKDSNTILELDVADTPTL